MPDITRICEASGQPFTITEWEQSYFQERGLPLPTLSSLERHRLRLAFRNERCLYRDTCDLTGKPMLSLYSEDKPYKVYSPEAWWGDAWDVLDFGQDFDFNRPFFEQYQELQLKVPRLALVNVNAENSDYCNSSVGNKNCYLIFGGDFNEDSLYGTLCMHNRSVVDCDFSNQNELCYMLCDTVGCYGSQFIFDSKNCRDSYFLSDCSNVNDCILCTNLNNKSYCIRNVQYSKEEYLSRKKELINGNFQQQQKNWAEFLEIRRGRIVKFSHVLSCEEVSGDYLKNSKNCQLCFDVSDSQDLQDIVFATKSKDCFNGSMFGENTELCHSAVSILGAVDSSFCFFVINSSNVQYSEVILNSSDLFGCVGVRQKQYCILNKQYTREQYFELWPRIIEHMKRTDLVRPKAERAASEGLGLVGPNPQRSELYNKKEWGIFLPKRLSSFGYNETTAHDYYPLKREEAIQRGFKWHDENEVELHSAEAKPIVNLSDHISEIRDGIVNEILICEICRRNFKIIAQEIKFYRNLEIPVPRSCSECRHRLRMEQRNPRVLWKRVCMKCNRALETTYAPERSENVYCEGCYVREVY